MCSKIEIFEQSDISYFFKQLYVSCPNTLYVFELALRARVREGQGLSVLCNPQWFKSNEENYD